MFVTRHTATCTFSMIEEAAIPFTGYLPQVDQMKNIPTNQLKTMRFPLLVAGHGRKRRLPVLPPAGPPLPQGSLRGGHDRTGMVFFRLKCGKVLSTYITFSFFRASLSAPARIASRCTTAATSTWRRTGRASSTLGQGSWSLSLVGEKSLLL